MNTNVPTKHKQTKVPYQPKFESKDDYIKADLERQYQDTESKIHDLIEIIEQARYFRYFQLAEKMIGDLGETERIMWNMHEEGGTHE